MTAVPRLFEAVYHRIVKKGMAEKGWKRGVFTRSLEVGQGPLEQLRALGTAPGRGAQDRTAHAVAPVALQHVQELGPGVGHLDRAERVRDLLARHTVPVAGAVVVAADVQAMAYYDYYVMGRDSYLSHSTGLTPRSEPAPLPARRDTAPRNRAATPANSTIAPAPPRVMSVKELLKTTALSNGSNGNGANGHDRGSHD